MRERRGGRTIGPGKGRGKICECGEHAWAGIGHGKITFVSPEDFPLLDRQYWSYDRNYAIGGINRKMHLLHRVVLGAVKGQNVDHINRDKLDNRRENLRFVTRSQNSINRSNKNQFRGVRNEDGRWRASIGVNRKCIKLGTFKTAEEAALAYNEAAKKFHGEFAVLNSL